MILFRIVTILRNLYLYLVGTRIISCFAITPVMPRFAQFLYKILLRCWFQTIAQPCAAELLAENYKLNTLNIMSKMHLH
jgi:hypothetical protein